MCFLRCNKLLSSNTACHRGVQLQIKPKGPSELAIYGSFAHDRMTFWFQLLHSEKKGGSITHPTKSHVVHVPKCFKPSRFLNKKVSTIFHRDPFQRGSSVYCIDILFLMDLRDLTFHARKPVISCHEMAYMAPAKELVKTRSFTVACGSWTPHRSRAMW